MIIRAAQAQDWPEVEALLQACELPTDGARAHFADFIVCREGARLLGCAGAEIYGDAALLRSLAVEKGRRSEGLGDKLTNRVLADLKARKVATVALLTTTAEAYFAKRGFRSVERAALPVALSDSAELKGACPATAVNMVLRL